MTERERLEQAIVALEAQRAVLGDVVVETALAPLREKLAALSAPPAPEQRKQVTVLFADVSGFTAMSETMDAEEVRDTMNALWQRLDAAITAQGGVIDKHIGDAVMALWGVQSTREDDAERAIRAALDMQAVLRDECGTLKDSHEAFRRLPSSLRMRIGINTGLVLLGAIGSKGEFTAMGDTVNVASRLEHAAPVGDILISHDTYRHVRGLFDVTPQEPITVKGKTEPIQTYVVQRVKPRAFRMATRGVEGIETHMVGRDAELRTLQDAFRAAMENSETHMVTVAGDAGLGKSRLLYEFEKQLDLLPDPIFYLKGRSTPEMASIPYSIFRDLFRRRFDILESDSAAMVREKFEAGVRAYLDAERAHLVGHLVGFDFSATTAVQNLLGSPSFATLALADLMNYFRGDTADHQMVLFLEDIHWTDNPSLDLAARLLNELPDRRLLIVCLSRPALYERRPSWGQDARHIRLDLKPLTPDDSRALVNEILQKVEDLPDDLRELIVGSAEGIPFYAEELIKMLVEDGVIVRGEAHWKVERERLKSVRVPPTLTGILQARLDSLPCDEKELLQRASVVGRLFWDATAAALSAEGDRVLEIGPALEAVRARELIFRRDNSVFSGAQEYIFKHAILRDVTYETVLLKRRRVYHKQVAKWLEAYSGERLNEYTGLIAEHYERAGEKEETAVWLRRAGEAALNTGAFSEAIAAFERALSLLPEEDRSGRAGLLVKLGETHERQGDYPAAAARLRAGLALAREAQDSRTAGDALCGLSLVAIRQGAYDEARSLGEEALLLARDAHADARATSVRALRLLGLVAYYQGDYSTASRHSEDSLALARAISDRQGIANCLHILGIVSAERGDYVTAARYYEDTCAIAREIGDRNLIARCLNNQGLVFTRQGDYAAASHCYKESLTISREIGNRDTIVRCLANLGWVALLQGDYGVAMRHFGESLTLFRELGDREGIANCLSNLGQAAAGMGDTRAAADYFRGALAEARAIGRLPLVLDVLAEVAGLRARAGEYTRAAELIGLALGHPATYSDVAHDAEPVLSALRAVLPADQLTGALERGKSLDLDVVVGELLAYHTDGGTV